MTRGLLQSVHRSGLRSQAGASHNMLYLARMSLVFLVSLWWRHDRLLRTFAHIWANIWYMQSSKTHGWLHQLSGTESDGHDVQTLLSSCRDISASTPRVVRRDLCFRAVPLHLLRFHPETPEQPTEVSVVASAVPAKAATFM